MSNQNNEENKPHIFKFRDIEIQFPFPPYKIQENYMRQMIRALNESKNALLESPTGTGKTLSILCSSLAWLNKQIEINNSKKASKNIYDPKNFINDDDDLDLDFFGNGSKDQDALEQDEEEIIGPRIFFSSRTHSQLSQSINELKKINFGNNKGIVLAGRDLLCINEDVTKLNTISEKNQACRSKIGANCSCIYYSDVEKKVRNLKEFRKNHVLDVEDLVNLGQKHIFCPYFASRYLEKKSQVIFLPYNYLLDPKIRKAQKLQFNKDVIIFDEGHNIEKTCEESVSVDLRSDSVACCIREMQNIHNFYTSSLENLLTQDQATLDAVKEFTPEDLCTVKLVLDNLETEVDNKVKEFQRDPSKKDGAVCHDQWIFELMKKIDLSFDTIRKTTDIIDKVLAFLVCILPVKGPVATVASASLSSFKDFLNLLNPEEQKDQEEFVKEFKEKFKVYIEIVEESANDSSSKSQNTPNNNKRNLQSWLTKKQQKEDDNLVKKWILHVWCLSPSIGLKGLLNSNVRSVVLTSGTLAPLESYEAEFGTEFGVKIQNRHIIDKSQMSIFTVNSSLNEVTLNSAYANKDNDDYYKALGDTIVDICKTVPDGIFLFFSSYAVMNASVRRWKDNESSWKIWSTMNKTKPVFQESQSRDEFKQQISDFKLRVDVGKGAIFFGICRGKLSEGIDLGDKYTRGVILAGLPYPASKSPRVELKRQYLNKVKYQNYDSNKWYQLQMRRALNQAIGRAIRHKDDYGCVFLLDYRFENQIKSLSLWCQDFVKSTLNYRDIFYQTKKFFEDKVQFRSEKVPVNVCKQESTVVEKVKNEEMLDLDFSLSEYTNKNSKKKSSKKRVFESDLEDKNRKRRPEQAGDVFDLLGPSNKSAGNKKAFKKKRQHLVVKYEENGSNDLASTSGSANAVLSNNDDNSMDSVVIL